MRSRVRGDAPIGPRADETFHLGQRLHPASYYHSRRAIKWDDATVIGFVSHRPTAVKILPMG
jgi:hypothetical protein